MTIKEMIQKVNGYNEVATVIGQPTKSLRITETLAGSSATMFTFVGTDYSKVKKVIKNVYTDEVANALLTDDTFDFAGDYFLNENTDSNPFNFDIV